MKFYKKCNTLENKWISTKKVYLTGNSDHFLTIKLYYTLNQVFIR